MNQTPFPFFHTKEPRERGPVTTLNMGIGTKEKELDKIVLEGLCSLSCAQYDRCYIYVLSSFKKRTQNRVP